MALFHQDWIKLDQLDKESVSVALVTDDCKTLHVTTKFWMIDGEIKPSVVYEITDRKTKSLYGFSDLKMAIAEYNRL